MQDPIIQQALSDMRSGRVETALQSLRDVMRRTPEDHNVAQILALLLSQVGELDEASALLARTVAAEPQAVQYRNNYGTALLQWNRFAEAEEQYLAAVQIDPNYAKGWLGLSAARLHQLDSSGAVDAAERALQIQPGWPEGLQQLVLAVEGAGAVDEAVEVSKRALHTHPRHPRLWSHYLLLLNYLSLPADDVAAEHFRFGSLFPLPQPPPIRDRSPERALHIGILSSDLRTHSVGFFVEPILAHVPSWARMTVFSTVASPHDAMAQHLRQFPNAWLEVGSADDAALNRCIQDHQIDILIELNGHTGANRLTALAQKPAPLIVSAVGYPNTTGMRAIDYRLVDAVTDPPGSESRCAERLLRLEPCFLLYTPPLDASEPVYPGHDVPITFGSCNALSKISDATLELWSRILSSVPNSRLLLKSQRLEDDTAREILLERLESVGIEPHRVECLAHCPTIREHLQVYSRMHISLDTTPYTGTTTTCEALWMGVPVVSLCGDRHVSRVGASLLSATGLSHLIARHPHEYVDIAIRLSNEPDRLRRLRHELRDRLRASTLLDGVAYAARFFDALRNCWVADAATQNSMR